MPSHNTLQTIPPEIRNQIYSILAATTTRTILGRKFVRSHRLGEYDGVIPTQFACAAAIHPLSMTCRQPNLESAQLLSTALDPPAYDLVVNNFDVEQLDLFREFTECPMNCSREFSLRCQFDSGVLQSALDLETHVGVRGRTTSMGGAKTNAQRGKDVYPSKVKRFLLHISLAKDDGERKAVPESQGRMTVQVLRRIRRIMGEDLLPGDRIMGNMCIRFEALLDTHIWRLKGASDVWRVDGKPDNLVAEEEKSTRVRGRLKDDQSKSTARVPGRTKRIGEAVVGSDGLVSGGLGSGLCDL